MANLDPGPALGVAMSQPTLGALQVTGSSNSALPTQIGMTAGALVGFHGASAVAQATAITQVGTSVPVAACASFGLTSTQLTALVVGLNAVIVALQNKGLTA